MKRTLIKGAVFLSTFLVAMFIIGKVTNKGNTDMTVDMAPASFPIIYMGMAGYEYNELHGYSDEMNSAFMRDQITVLQADRTTGFTIETYGQDVTGLSFEVRSVDGSRLIENTKITEYTETKGELSGEITIKDLIEKDTEYELIFLLDMDSGRTIRYYTRMVWSENYYAAEKIAYVLDFNESTFDRENASDLAKYLESNSEGDNTTLNLVTIHSSLSQVTWGSLDVKRETKVRVDLEEIAAQTATLTTHFIVSTTEDKEKNYYYVEEYYRIRYTSDRIYLLDYERTMTQYFDEDNNVFINDKVVIGIESPDMPFLESEDGNIFVFEVGGKLLSYNVVTNQLAVLFCFYDKDYTDDRTTYQAHDMKVLDVDEAGNVQFAVYGYMNRGQHEGEVGLCVYYYNATLNTIEEAVYVPYDGSYEMLKVQIEELLYMNRENFLYFMMDSTVYEVNLEEKTVGEKVYTLEDESIQISDSEQMVVWQQGGDIYSCTELIFMNLSSMQEVSVEAPSGQYIMPLGFMGEDLIYGLAYVKDVVTDSLGHTLYPMYGVYIQNSTGDILKEYEQENIYVTACTTQDNQITLERLLLTESGTFEETSPDQIVNNEDEKKRKNTVGTVATENYGKIVQITAKKNMDSKTLKMLTPKEVLYEGSREIVITASRDQDRYYVYGQNGVMGIFRDPAKAVNMAYTASGVVINDKGDYIWIKGNRVTRNQIMAITANSITEEKDSVAVCLDAILKYKGIVRNSEYLLANGQTVLSVLESNLENAQILDLSGCPLDAILYYVNREIPVMATLKDNTAVLIIGFNDYNVVVMDPVKGTVEKRGMQDTTEWLADSGNRFITYSE